MRGLDGILEVEYGEYPQKVASGRLQFSLERLYNSGVLKQTGKIYTTDSRKTGDYNLDFSPNKLIEYEYQGKKYVRVKANFDDDSEKLSNGETYQNGDYVWVEVSPVKWIVDEKYDIALSHNLLFSGVQFKHKRDYKGDFENTDIYKYMMNYFSKELISISVVQRENSVPEYNPYGFNYENVSEEDIIKSYVIAGVPVYLHGRSGDGKSARVKQIDENCEIVSVGTLTAELLVGMAIKNNDQNRVDYISPPWYRRLVEKCEKEPDKIHVLFLDELTNASLNMQKYAYSIALDRKVNDYFELPKNARVVAAGNEMADSLAANALAEPLFNRFAHVYIETNVINWLPWAIENNIHPAICAFISWKGDEALRSKYTGEKPNADPRKWEMASKILYKVGNPELLRALIGSDITTEFVNFCRQQVVTLEDVIKENYNDDYFSADSSKKYATVIGLLSASEKDLQKVRNFIKKLEPEFLTIFDNLWTRGRDDRLELIASLRLSEEKGRKI